MTVLGRGLVFQPVLVTQTCTYNSNNITLQIIDITDFPSKKKKKLKNIPTPTPPPTRPTNKKKKKATKECGGGCCSLFVCWLVGCLTSQQQASVSQGRICSDNFTCCNTEIEVADQTFYLTQSQYTDTGPTSPSADPITPGAWQGSHWSANF